MSPLLAIATAAAWSLTGGRWWCQDLPLAFSPGSEEARAALDDGFAPWTAWNERLAVRPGSVEAAGGFSRDGVSRVSLDDPDDELGTGILAATIAWTGDDSGDLDGLELDRVVEADIVFNDGVTWGGCPGYERSWVSAHEVGHVLGLGHSQDPEALMYASTPECTPAPPLSPDDAGGADQLYPDETFLHDAMTPTPSSGDAPLTATVVLQGGAEPQTVTWDFGDGTGGSGNPVSHTWTEPAEYLLLASETGPFCEMEVEGAVEVTPGSGPGLPGDTALPPDGAGGPAAAAPEGCGCGAGGGGALTWGPILWAIACRRRCAAPAPASGPDPGRPAGP